MNVSSNENNFQNRKANQSWLAQSFRKAFSKIDQHRSKKHTHATDGSMSGVTSSKSQNQLLDETMLNGSSGMLTGGHSASNSSSSKRSSLSDEEASQNGTFSSRRSTHANVGKLALIQASNNCLNTDENEEANSDSEYENDVKQKMSASRARNGGAASLVNTKRSFSAHSFYVSLSLYFILFIFSLKVV